jgi:hypothetical protein
VQQGIPVSSTIISLLLHFFCPTLGAGFAGP